VFKLLQITGQFALSTGGTCL